MSKGYRIMTRKVNGKVREVREDSVIMEIPLPVAEIVSGTRYEIERLAEEIGLALMLTVIECEVEEVAGPKHRKAPRRSAYWWGSQPGYVYYEDKKIPIWRPRVRRKDGREVEIKAYKVFQRPDMAKRLCMGDILMGLSMQNYEAVAERFLEGYGIKKSSVSRRYIRATRERMKELLERDLSGLDIRVIYIDGIERQGYLLVVAIGIDTSGKKHVLGLWQGATENLEVCLGLLDDLERRGLDMEKNYLFVLDGSKALRSAVARKFSRRALVQRCQVHKRKNVKGYLPPEYQASIDARIRAAYNMESYEDAKESLERTIKYLERLNPSAAASLREGLEETLTIHRLGISGPLRKTLSSTNVIESSFSLAGSIMDRVKRWRDGEMVQRWVAVSLLEAEKRFKRVKGYRDIPKLIAAIDREIARNRLTGLKEVA